MILVLLLAASAPRWTEADALAPHRARLDADGDGRVARAEYDRVAWSAPPFAAVDLDGDGDLSVAELLVLTRAQDPTRFVPPVEPVDAPAGAAAPVFTLAEQARWETLLTLADQLRAAGRPVPAPDEVRAAVFGDPEAGARVLAALEAGYAAAGWPWPLAPGGAPPAPPPAHAVPAPVVPLPPVPPTPPLAGPDLDAELARAILERVAAQPPGDPGVK